MPAQTVNYQCPACMGPLHFSGETGKLQCDYCGSQYDPAEIEKLYEKRKTLQRRLSSRQKQCQMNSRGRLRACAPIAAHPAVPRLYVMKLQPPHPALTVEIPQSYRDSLAGC